MRSLTIQSVKNGANVLLKRSRGAMQALILAVIVPSAAYAGSVTFMLCTTSGCKPGGIVLQIDNKGQTRYPIVLAHGMSGFNRHGNLDYWYGIPEAMAAHGAIVFETEVSSFGNSTGTRGEQLLHQVRRILAITGAKKVNLIGHSQGVEDARYVAGVAPELVASVTGIGGPNTGSAVADLVSRRESGPERIRNKIEIDAISAFWKLLETPTEQQYTQDVRAGVMQLTTAGMAEFNKRFPAGLPTGDPCGQGQAVDTATGIHYYSWGGVSQLTAPPFKVDVSDPLLLATSAVFNGQPNDGLVGKCSNHLGLVIKDDYFMNHFDLVNQIKGIVSPREVSPITLFVEHTARLKAARL